MKLSKFAILLFLILIKATGKCQVIEKINKVGTGKWNEIKQAQIFNYNRIAILISGYDGWSIQILNSDLSQTKIILTVSKNKNPDTYDLIKNINLLKSSSNELLIDFNLTSDTTIYIDSVKISNSKLLTYNFEINSFHYENRNLVNLDSKKPYIETVIKNNEIYYKKLTENKFKHLCYESNPELAASSVYFLNQDNETGYIIFPKGLENIDFCQSSIDLSVYEQGIAKINLWQSTSGLTIKIPNFLPSQSYHCFTGDKINILTSSCCSAISLNGEYSIDLINDEVPNQSIINLTKFKGDINTSHLVNIPCNLQSGKYSLRISTSNNSVQTKAERHNIYINNPLSYSINITPTYKSLNDSVLIEISDFSGNQITWLNEFFKPVTTAKKTFLSCPGKYYLKLTSNNLCDSVISYLLLKETKSDTILFIKNVTSPHPQSDSIINPATFINNINYVLRETIAKNIQNPIPLIIFHLIIIVISAILFRKRDAFLKTNLKDELEINFNSIFYVIDLSTPIVDLNCSKHFIPKNKTKSDKFNWILYRSLILWGWIFATMISGVLINYVSTYYNTYIR